jgi:5-formyltetrahydrofolate cyclo-ligase
VALAFNLAIADHLPHDELDVPVDKIVTELELIQT